MATKTEAKEEETVETESPFDEDGFAEVDDYWNQKPTNGHVYKAVHKILSELGVAKGGQLPSNMGGKPYITAVDLSLAIKSKFVTYGLILIPYERVASSTVQELTNGKLATSILIEGSYTVRSLVDGSSLVFTGVGDGLALGTAVSANIASTNALKNGLLRLFLVTEQSAEDAGKNGISDDEAKPAAPKGKIPDTTARATPTKTAGLKPLQDKLTALVADKSSPLTGDTLNAHGHKYWSEKTGKPIGEVVAADWFGDLDALKYIDSKIDQGEVA